MNEVKELVLTPLLAEARFVTIWLSTPIMLIGIYELLCLLSKEERNQVSPQESSSRRLFWKPNLDLVSSITLIVFLIFLFLYIYLMFFKGGFAYYDNHQFTHFSLIGKPFYMPIWRESGRFWPLGLQEYNFLALLGKNFFIYQAFSVFQLLIVLLVINKIFAKFPTWHRLATMTIVMVTPSFVISFFWLIYPERNVIFGLSLLILCCHSLMKPENANSRAFIYGALVCAQFCLYYKEPVFILIGSFAGIRLAVNIHSERKNFLEWKKILRFFKKNYLDFSLILLSLIFFVLYRLIVSPHVVEKYQYNSQDSFLSTLSLYVNNNFLIIFFIVSIALKLAQLLFSRKDANILWEPLALGALFYLLVFAKLNMYTSYYLAPVEFIAVLYLSQLFHHFLVHENIKSKRFTKLVFYSALVLLIFFPINQNLQKSSHDILWKKGLVSGSVQLANSLTQYAASSDKKNVNLFFPSPTSSYSITIFGAFLESKGIDLYYRKDNSSLIIPTKNRLSSEELPELRTTFMLKSPLSFQDNLCSSWFVINCFQAMEPDAGDLIVILPGILGVSPEIINDLKSEAKIIFAYQQQSNFSVIEKILLAISRKKDFSYIDVYILQKI